MNITREQWQRFGEEIKGHEMWVEQNMLDHPDTVCECGHSSYYHLDEITPEAYEYISTHESWRPRYLVCLDTDNGDEHLFEAHICMKCGVGGCEGFWRK